MPSTEQDNQLVTRAEVWQMIEDALRPRTRTDIKAERLQRVAQVYGSADHAPTQAVADHFVISHRTAGLWVRQAREAGCLAPYSATL